MPDLGAPAIAATFDALTLAAVLVLVCALLVAWRLGWL